MVICPSCGKNVAQPGPPVRLDEIKSAIERLGAKDRSMLHRWLLAKFDIHGEPLPQTHNELVRRNQMEFVDAIVAKRGPLDEDNVRDLELLFGGTEADEPQ